MNLDSVLRVGSPPWLPSPGATSLDVWHMYNIPLVGTFRHGRSTVLFATMGDASEDATVWAYCELSDAQVADLESVMYENTSELQAGVEEIFEGAEAAVAMAVDLEIRFWGRVQVDGSLLDATGQFIEQVGRHLSADGRANVQRAEIKAAARVLEELPFSGNVAELEAVS